MCYPCIRPTPTGISAVRMGAATIDIVTFDIDGTICVSDKITQGVV